MTGDLQNVPYVQNQHMKERDWLDYFPLISIRAVRNFQIWYENVLKRYCRTVLSSNNECSVFVSASLWDFFLVFSCVCQRVAANTLRRGGLNCGLFSFISFSHSSIHILFMDVKYYNVCCQSENRFYNDSGDTCDWEAINKGKKKGHIVVGELVFSLCHHTHMHWLVLVWNLGWGYCRET